MIRRALPFVAVTIFLMVLAVVLPNRNAYRKPSHLPIKKVGVLLNGSTRDRSYTQAQYEAIAAVSAERGLTLVCHDNVPADDSFPALAQELIRDGCGILYCDHYLFDPYLKELADQYPEVFFLNTSGNVQTENLGNCLGRVYQVRYLSGLVAGLQTRTNEIGYILAFLTPETIRQLNAFTIGVRKVNPDAVVFVRRTDDWQDGEKAAVETTALLDAHHIDVLTQHVNPITPLRVAEERGIASIGNNADNRELFPKTTLTACVFDWKPFLDARIGECLEQRFRGQRFWEGLRTGLVGLSPFTDLVPPATRAVVEQEAERIISGEYDVFFGPVTDIYGTVQVRQDENLSDQQLLYGMYWFVDGVVVE